MITEDGEVNDRATESDDTDYVDIPEELGRDNTKV